MPLGNSHSMRRQIRKDSYRNVLSHHWNQRVQK